MKQILLLASSLLFSFSSSASLLELTGKNGSIENVNLATSAAISLDNKPVQLQSAGAGLRSKKIVFVNIKVYVAQLFVSNLDAFKNKKTDSPSPLTDQSTVAIQLHFLRDVDAKKVQDSFEDALKANKINVEEASISQILKAVKENGAVKKGSFMTILGYRAQDGSEVISYESPEGNVSEVKGASGLIEKIFSIWLGKPSDDGVAELKKNLFKT